MRNDIPFNVLNNRGNIDAIEQVAAMINSSGCNRSQRKRLEKALSRTTKLSEKAQKKLDHSAFVEFQANLDSNMRRFFSVLGIVLKDEYNFEETDDKEEISDMFNLVNQYLEQYRELSTDEVADICYEKTGLTLIATK